MAITALDSAYFLDDSTDTVLIELETVGSAPAPEPEFSSLLASPNRTSISLRQPGSVDNVEQAQARIYSVDVQAVRGQVWTNLTRLVGETSVEDFLPTAVRRVITFARAHEPLR